MYYNPKDLRFGVAAYRGRDFYVLAYKGQIVGCGDVESLRVKTAGRRRLDRFEKKSSALIRDSAPMSAAARLRKFTFDSTLIP